MPRTRRVLLCATIILLGWTATGHASAPVVQRTIQEGVGWDHFIVGASAKSLIDAFGFPDKTSTGQMMRWDKLGINCLLDQKSEAVELRFDRRFKGLTGSGIKFGMSAEKVRTIYGDPSQVEWRGGGMKLIWPTRGVLIWFHGNTVYQIVIFIPRA